MRAILRAAAASMLLPVLAACSTSGPSASPEPAVPVGGAASDLAALNGRWEGSYSSPDTGRSGSIVFEFRGGTGAGDVLMVPKSSADAPANPPAADSLKGMPQVLTIQFVQAQGGDLSGALSAYTDPDCSCQVTTTFRGRREGEAVRGTFTTVRTSDPEKKANGTWSVQRSNRPPEKKG